MKQEPYFTDGEEKLMQLPFWPCEIWRAISGYPDYYISNYGRCASTKRAKAIILKRLKHGLDKRIHYALRCSGKTINRSAHRLVLTMFKGTCPEGMQGSHIDGNLLNNHIDNLKWETPLQNTRRKKDHGTQIYGSKNVLAKLTETDIPKIKKMYKQGDTQTKIAKLFGISTSIISGIIAGKRWHHV